MVAPSVQGVRPPGSDELRLPPRGRRLLRLGLEVQRRPRRSEEFLDINNASANGLTLTGSGTERVTTAGYFAPGQAVTVSGATDNAQTVTADASGRITFDVDLGPPHRFQEYTVQADAAQALQGSGYFKTRTVGFEALP